MKQFEIITFLLILLVFRFSYSQDLMINEIMASNNTTISDNNGDFPDWIELYNPGESAINLAGYGISDDPDDNFKWSFPKISLEPQEHLLVFASGKDQRPITSHWETLIREGDICKYRVNNNEAAAGWQDLNYDDSDWLAGATGIGYGDNDDNTQVPSGTLSFYARFTFDIEDLENITAAILHIDYDDAFIAYLNGKEIARANITGDSPAYDHPADTYSEPKIVQGKKPVTYSLENFDDQLLEGENLLAFQIHNHNSGSSDLTFIPFFTVGMQSPPPDPRGAPDLLDLKEIAYHTNFRIDADGESIILVDSLGQLQDSVSFDFIGSDITLGRKPDGADDWYFFNEPTPGAPNQTPGFLGSMGQPDFSHPGGFYQNPIQLQLSANYAEAKIRYTTDGSKPNEHDNLYKDPILLDSVTVIRARVFADNKIPGPIITNTYIINKDHELPVISISTDPANFWDQDSGIYVLGDDYEQENPHYGANFWQDWERPIHVEFFETNGDKGFDIDAGVKIFGGWSRAAAQKSLAIFARSEYGYGDIDYKIFPDLPIESFEAFVLRNSANDRPFTMFRDGMMQELLKGSNIDLQAYRPAVLYLNGKYWGLYNLREKLNEHYVASHHNIDPDNIDLLEGYGIAKHGDSEAYWNFYEYFESHNFAYHENYKEIKKQMDIQNFIEYQIAEIYYDNTDWPGNNIKYWRERSEDGRWRWILYDTDFGFGLYDGFGFSANQRYKHNTLEFATASNGPGWPNPPWSTLILRKLLRNRSFTKDFLNRYADFINSRFKSDRVISVIDSLQAHIAGEMRNHYNRWKSEYYWQSFNDWNGHVQTLRTFARKRPGYAHIHILNSELDVDGVSLLSLNIQPRNSGKIKINSLTIAESWKGHYFKALPIQLQAIPAPGYKFEKWTGIDSTAGKIELSLSQNQNIEAVFVADSSAHNGIVINEINYNSADNFDPGDWVELYNITDQEQDLSDWHFTDSDSDHVFVLPNSTILGPDDYLVLCENKDDFQDLYPDVDNIIGVFDFGLSGDGELIKLYNNVAYLVDSVSYDDKSPWPEEADGKGATLGLLDPQEDNSLPKNWRALPSHGTPGQPNELTDIQPANNLIENYTLGQNYPNPFNNSTTIPFTIPKTGSVTIKVYDLKGRLINTLLDKDLKKGKYNIRWKTDKVLTSGIYFYQIQIDNHFLETRKAVLIK